MRTHRDGKGASQKTVPRIIGVVDVTVVEEYGPMVTRNCELAAVQLLFNPERCQKRTKDAMNLYTKRRTSLSRRGIAEPQYTRGEIHDRP
jgi:hypothetical protein